MQQRRTTILIVLAIILQFAIRIGLSLATHPSRSPSPAVSTPAKRVATRTAAPQPLELEGWPQDVVASVLSAKPRAVTGLKLVLPDARGFGSRIPWEWECQVGGRRVLVSTTGGGHWNLRLPREAERTASHCATLIEARATAVAVVRRRLGSVFYNMEPSVAEPLPRGDFYFSWSQPSTDTFSGASARVTIDPAGRIRSYSETPGSPRITAPQSLPAEQLQPPPDAATFLASLLGAKPEQLTPVKADREDASSFEINGRQLSVFGPPPDWVVRTDSDAGFQPGIALSGADARKAAQTYLRRRWQRHLNTERMSSYNDGGMLKYSFGWQESLGPGVMSGNRASLTLYGDGTLKQYWEHRAPPGLSKDMIKVSKAQARAVADRLVGWGANAEGRKYTFKSQTLTLWDETMNRPMWSVQYVPSGTQEDWRRVPVRFARISVDAMTGGASYGY